MSDHGFASLGPALLARKGGARPAMRPQLPPPESSEQEIAALADEQLEDLGWNDMGESGEGSEPRAARGPGAEVIPITQDFGDRPAAPTSPIVHRQQKSLEQRLLADAVMTGDEQDDEDEDQALNEAEYDLNEAEYDLNEADEDFDEPANAYASLTPMAERLPAAPAVSETPSLNPPSRTGQPRAAAAPRQPAAASTPRRAAFTLRLDADRHLKLRLAATMQGVSAQALLTEALDAMLAQFDDLEAIAARLKRH
jgi:hypothetical protein